MQREKTFADMADAAYKGYASTRKVNIPTNIRKVLNERQHGSRDMERVFRSPSSKKHTSDNGEDPVHGTI
jgi:hypothetical protein